MYLYIQLGLLRSLARASSREFSYRLKINKLTVQVKIHPVENSAKLKVILLRVKSQPA